MQSLIRFPLTLAQKWPVLNAYTPKHRPPYGMAALKRFWQEEEGAATLEVVIIIAVLLAVALLFNEQLRNFAKKIFDKVFNDDKIISKIGVIG